MLGTLFLARGDDPKPTTIILHGVPGIEKNFDLAHFLRIYGWNSLIFHYRGCWGSEGRYSFKSILQDTQSALNLLAGGHYPQVDRSRLILIGHSLGGWATILIAAQDTRVKGVVAIGAIADPREIPFTEEDALESFTPFLSGLSPSDFVSQWRELGQCPTPLDLISQISPRPILVLHGQNDELVSPSQSVKLLESAQMPCKLVIHEEANHSFVWHREWLVSQIVDWLNKQRKEFRINMVGKELSNNIWRISDPNTSPKIESLTLVGDPSTLDEISSQLPTGVYTTFRTYGHNKILPLGPQFRRLEESAALMKKPVSLNQEVIRHALKKAVQLYQEKEIRIRLTLDLVDRPGSIYIAIETLVMPEPEDYKNGVITVTKQAERDNPKAKNTSFLSSAEQFREQASKSVNEVLLVNRKGLILEGLSSNFFAIKDGEIWAENEHVLSGITRSLVLDEGTTAQINVQFCAVHISEIGYLEEAFITSASRSVLPIQKIDQQYIGSGKPGCVTKKIMRLFQERIQRQVEDL